VFYTAKTTFNHTRLNLLMYQAVGLVPFRFGMRLLITLSKTILIAFRTSQTNSYETNKKNYD